MRDFLINLILLAIFVLLITSIFAQVLRVDGALDDIGDRLTGIEAKFYTLELAE